MQIFQIMIQKKYLRDFTVIDLENLENILDLD